MSILDEDDDLNLIHANFFFVDIVGLSDPDLSTKTQTKKIKVLNRIIQECSAFSTTRKELRVMLPTGDGCCIGFLQGPDRPLKLAIQVHHKLDKYNQSKIPSETVRIRIGLHNGICFVVDDVEGTQNVWGPGIIYARRVMDFGDDGHILMSPKLAEDLRELSDEHKKIIKPVHDFTLKHGKSMLIYSAYDGKTFGNSHHPEKGSDFRSKMGEEIVNLQKTTTFPKVEINLDLMDESTQLIHHTRKYEISNISNRPIEHLLHGVATDVEKYSINDLNLKIYDENNSELKISSINVDKPFTKEFTTVFSKPILPDEKGRTITFEYDLEEPERYFANAFLTDSNSMKISMTYPSTLKDPILNDIVQETDSEILSKIIPKIEEKDGRKSIVWEKDEITKGDTFKLQW